MKLILSILIVLLASLPAQAQQAPVVTFGQEQPSEAPPFNPQVQQQCPNGQCPQPPQMTPGQPQPYPGLVSRTRILWRACNVYRLPNGHIQVERRGPLWGTVRIY